MSVAQGVLANIAYKAYASGAMVAGTEDLAPPATGAQYLRRVSSNLDLKIASFRATEIRPDLQVASFRHGARSVTGDIAGELSPGTWFDFHEAVARGTRVAGATTSQADFTSLAASSAGTFTVGSGNPVTSGFSVGDIVNFTGNTVSAGNDNVNFLILGFSTSNNRVISVYPNPVTSTASTTFTMVAPGHSVIVPLTGQVSRKYGIEIYDTDVTVSRLFTEVRATKYAVNLPTSGIVTSTVSFMGRDMVVADGDSYFTTPTAVTVDDVVASTSGVVMVGGARMGIITAMSFDCTLAAAAADVIGQVYTADILLGTVVVTGQMTVYLQDLTLMNDFLNETEVSINAMVQSNTLPNSPAISFYLPRVKYSGAAINLTGEAGQIMTMPFTALLYEGTAPGVPVTTIRVADTSV